MLTFKLLHIKYLLLDIKAAMHKNVLTPGFPFQNGRCKIDFGRCIYSFVPLGDNILQLRNQVFNEFVLKEGLVLQLILLDVGNPKSSEQYGRRFKAIATSIFSA